MVSFSLFKSSITLNILLALADYSSAAVQCDLITSAHCGRNHHRINHKLPTNVGSTYYVDGFHGGVMNAKFQSMTESVPGNNENFDLTYNFNLGDYDGTYWIILPNSFGGGNACYAVYKNCDVTLTFWEKKNPLPTFYQLA
ncbi:hypothetical protein FDECE_14653 [Fusarium decemcellulare]|nr:hypothetical protein FDECE_14653 [Fusarium decemcellulare]